MRYYRPDLDLYVETDASGKGIGMVLLQSNSNERESLYPIAYGSKTLTTAETRYANIEPELLGVVGALEKVHYSWTSSDHIDQSQTFDCHIKEGLSQCPTGQDYRDFS